jgi:hypothetical protein
MRRSELSPEVRAELRALDAILAREPVGEEDLELAALVDSVRADAPRIDPAFADRLDRRVAARFDRPSAPRRHPARKRLALAGGSLVAVVVTAMIVVSGGVLNGTSAQRKPLNPTTVLPGAAATPGTFNAATPATSTGATGSTTAAGVAVSPSAQAGVGAIPRLVARSGSLTLAAPPGRMQAVANGIVASTERVGGVVESSKVMVHGLSSSATFSLSVPSPKLPALISSLSSLAGVRSLSQSTLDITKRYTQAQAGVATEKAESGALIKALAAATTLAEEESIQQKITALDGRIAAATAHLGALVSKAHNARLAVNVVTAAAAASSGGSGPVNRALGDSLRVLDVALAIALVAFAIMLPLALLGLAVWWSAATLRQRARERAFEA